MTIIYNKGKYRGGEWVKHLRPFLKKTGNRKWRRTAKNRSIFIDDDNSITYTVKPKRKQKAKSIEVKFKLRFFGD